MIKSDKSKFPHQIKEQVKFHEVDMLGVCNNAVYFNYFEDARLRYTQDIKKKYNLKELLEGNSFFIMAHNDCDYYESAHLDDELIIYTRISFIKNSSFGFEHLVEKVSSQRIIASGRGVVVHIDKSKMTPLQLLSEFLKAINQYKRN